MHVSFTYVLTCLNPPPLRLEAIGSRQGRRVFNVFRCAASMWHVVCWLRVLTTLPSPVGVCILGRGCTGARANQ
eukprot:6444056-Alexandrium_andersonii.AAC.1